MVNLWSLMIPILFSNMFVLYDPLCFNQATIQKYIAPISSKSRSLLNENIAKPCREWSTF